MSVHRSISLWGVWYLQRKSTPKNEYLRLKILVFWRLSEDFESEEIGVTLKTCIHSRNMKREDFCFRSFIFSFLSHRKHRTVKEGRGKTKETFSSDAHLKILHLPNPFEWSHWKSHTFQSISSVTETKIFWSLRIFFDWGVRNSLVRIAYKWGTW